MLKFFGSYEVSLQMYKLEGSRKRIGDVESMGRTLAVELGHPGLGHDLAASLSSDFTN